MFLQPVESKASHILASKSHIKHGGYLLNERPVLFLRLRNAQPKVGNIWL